MTNYTKQITILLLIMGFFSLLSSIFINESRATQTAIIVGAIFISSSFIIYGFRIIIFILENRIIIKDDVDSNKFLSVSYNYTFQGHFIDEILDDEESPEHTIKVASVLIYNLNEIPDYDNNPSNYVSYIESYLEKYIKEHTLNENVKNGDFFLDIISITRI